MEGANEKSPCNLVGPPESGACRVCLECHTTWPVSDLEYGLCPHCYGIVSQGSPKVEAVSGSYKVTLSKKAKAIKGQLNLFDGRL